MFNKYDKSKLIFHIRDGKKKEKHCYWLRRNISMLLQTATEIIWRVYESVGL